jgi:hypothetical protein
LSELKLKPTEQRVYEMVCQGDLMCRQLTPMESGAVPNLIKKGLVEIYKKNVSPYRVKKIKFLRLKT